jgi:hypothetical protein
MRISRNGNRIVFLMIHADSLLCSYGGRSGSCQLLSRGIGAFDARAARDIPNMVSISVARRALVQPRLIDPEPEFPDAPID